MLGAIALTEGATVAGAMETAFGTIATDAMSAIAGIIPVAAPILGSMVVIGLAIKAFNKIRAGRG